MIQTVFLVLVGCALSSIEIDELFSEVTDPSENATGQGTIGSSERASEFGVANEEDIQRLIGKNENTNTKRSTNTWVNRFEKWAAHRGEPTDLATIQKDKLDGVLQRFYSELKKENGSDYEPDSLKVMQTSLNRYLLEKGCGYSIL